MALGAYYAQTARFDYLLLFGVGLLFVHFVQVGVALARRLLVFGEGTVGVRDSHFYHVVVVALLPHALFGEVFGVAAQKDVGAATRHVSGYGHCAVPARLSDYFGFAGVVLGVENVVLYAVAAKKAGYLFGLVYGDGTYEHGLTLFVAVDHFLNYRLLFALYGGEDLIGVVRPYDGSVGGDADDVERIYRSELRLLGLCRTRHARKLVVQPEEVLESYGGVSLVLFAHLYVFLGFDCLVQTVGIPSAHHEPAREFIDYHYFAFVGDDIVFVADEQFVGFERLLDVVVEVGVFDVAEVFDVEELFCLFGAPFGYRDRLILAVDDVVPRLHILQYGGELVVYLLFLFGKFVTLFLAVGHTRFGCLFVVVEAAVQRAHEPVDVDVELRTFAALARNYEGRTRLVDEDGVDFVDYAIVELALDHCGNGSF